MKRLLQVLMVSSLSSLVFGSAPDSYKQSWYDLLSQGELVVMRDRIKSANVFYVRKKLLDGSANLLPATSKLCSGTSDSDDITFLYNLVDESKQFPALLPFLKKTYSIILSKYKNDHAILNHFRSKPWFPKEKDVDAYPSSFEPGSGEEIVLGPLLNPGKITRKQYEKEVANYAQGIMKSLIIFLDNRSDILFPGLAQELDESVSFPEGITDEFDKFFDSRLDVRFQRSNRFSKPDKKRDLAVLKAFWKESIQDEGLVAFVEKGHANFKKCYGYSAPVRSLKLKEGLTLGMYADKNKDSEVSKLCHKLEPAPTSFFVKAVVVGILSGISYLAYKKYRSYKNSTGSGSSVDLALGNA